LTFSLKGQNNIDGFVFEKDTVPLSFAIILLYQNDTVINGTSSDFDGFYLFENIPNGKYQISISYMGLKEEPFEISVASKDVTINLKMTKTYYQVCVGGCGPWFPLINHFYNHSQQKITASEINERKVKEIEEILSTLPTVTSNSNNQLSVKGSRTNSTDYYIDGQRVLGTLQIPTSSINTMTVYSGGISAKF
jgi:hypothetical protein